MRDNAVMDTREMKRPRLSRSRACGLAAIIVLGGFLRFYGITSKGIFFWDEATYLQSARYLCSVAAGVKSALGFPGFFGSAGPEERARLKAGLRGEYPDMAKPTHIALVAAGMAVLGDRDFCGSVVSAVFGILTIIVVFSLARAMGGPGLGLLAALLLAVSPLHVIYSRETLAEADSIFFLYAALALWYSSLEKDTGAPIRMFLAGICAGTSFTCNDRGIVIPFMFLSLWIAAFLYPQRRPRARSRGRQILFWAGLISPVVAWQGAYWVLKNRLGLTPLDYLDQLAGRSAYHAGLGYTGGGALSLPLVVAHFEGWPATLAVACGITLCCARRRYEDVMPLIVLFFPVVFYCLRPYHFLRIISLAIPCLSIIAGGFLAWLAGGGRALRPRAACAAVFLVCILGPALSRDARAILWRSRYANAIAFLKKQESARHYTTVDRLSHYYMGDARSVSRPPKEEDLRRGKGPRPAFPYLLADKQKYFQTSYGPSPNPWVTWVEEHCTPVFQEREDYDRLFFAHFAFEHSTDYVVTSEFLRKLPLPGASMLCVYRLSECGQWPAEGAAAR